MESDMVDDNLFDNKHFLSYKEAKNIAHSFIIENFPDCGLIDDQNFGMSFCFSFVNNHIKISFLSDRGEISYKLFVGDQEIDLCEYEPLLKRIEWFSNKNLQFLLFTIKRFIDEKK